VAFENGYAIDTGLFTVGFERPVDLRIEHGQELLP
jgi:hypothetical protein